MKEEPPAGTKCKDKFLVQSAIITPDRETKTLAELVSQPCLLNVPLLWSVATSYT